MYKKIIKEAVSQNKLAVFVGSGVSKNSNLPDWGELIESLKKELNINETDYLKIAQLYFLAVGEATYIQNIKKYFDIKSEPNNIHKYIFDLKPKYIITTNWDTLLEQYTNMIFTKYKVVSSDKDLVSSNIDKMIIKMHGDFNSEKFVFKEDDYINYSKNFPLIENFIKSILSTHTIIFIGYSYSDINLKYIFNWIQNSSSLQPPMFYFTFDKNEYQEKYLQNFKITTIVIPEYDKKGDYKYRLERFLDELNGFVNKKEVIQIVGNTDTNDIKTVENILNFIYDNLKILKKQNFILKEQISELLKECNFEYHNKQTFLYFYKDELTYGYHKSSKGYRKIYNLFLEFLLKKEEIFKCADDSDVKKIEKILNKIFWILINADINGIIIKKELNKFWPYEISSKCNKTNFVMFKGLFQDDFGLLESNETILDLQYNIFSLYHRREYKKAYSLNKKLLTKCFENDDYINLLFAFFNHNQLINTMRNPIFMDEKFKNDVSETWAYSLEKYDIEEKFFELPLEIRNQLKALKKVLTFDFLNDLYIKIDNEYQKKKEQEKKIRDDKGGFLDSNVDRFYIWQKELVLFYLRNMLLIDTNFRYRQIHKKLLEIELIRGLTFKEIKFDTYQLYAYIHFIDKKEFKNLFIKFVNDDMYKNKLIIDIKIQNWLMKLLKNNYELYKNTKTPLNFNKNDELSNIIFLFSIIKVDEIIKKQLIEQFIKMIEEYNANLDLYKSIGDFFSIQYKLFDLEVDAKNINKFYSMIIEKLLKYLNWQEINVWFHRAFESGYFDISFTVKKEVFDNVELIEEFINKISHLKEFEQIKISLSFLFGLYKISKDKTKEKIKKYLIDLYNKVERIDMKLHLFIIYILNGILKFDLKILKEYLEKYKQYLLNNNEFFFFEAIKYNLTNLIKEFNIDDKEILEINQKLNSFDPFKNVKGVFSI